ncbi:hypothetical protein CIK87_07115 [Prevotella sp. P5-64]|jgi:hypothetical protein|nr:hypothetical protein CIK87_07115 [Prevotella sp. P5-64]
MGYAKGKNDIAGIVRLAMFGSLYVTSDKKQEEEKGTKKYEEGQVSLLQIRLYDNWLEYSPLSNYK